MSTLFKAKGGETWSIVAMQTTGSDLDADAIRKANPGLSSPLKNGDTVQIPVTGSAASFTPGNPGIVVSGIKIGTFDDFEMARSIDAIGKASFVVPNEPETREIFVPGYYPTVEISALDTLRFTGRCESPDVDNQSEMKVLNVKCFSLPGIIETDGPGMDAYPLEYKKQNLQGIASDLCWKQGVATVFDGDTGPVFKRVDMKPGGSSLAFLTDLAKQRGLVISDDASGSLVFWKGKESGNPVGSYEKGMFPCVDIVPTIDDSQYYSSVTGYISGRTHREYRGDGYTIENNYKTDIIRPYVERFESIDKGELPTAVNALAGRMFSAWFSVTAEFSTWFDEKGNLFEPNTTIMLKSPEDYIVESYEFLIQTVTLIKQNDRLSCSLSCVIPGVFSGEIPSGMPWQK